jgi:hypothetical protein
LEIHIMNAWQQTWREGFAPRLSTAGLRALQQALIDDDPRLVQGVTTSPPALETLGDWSVEAACALTFCGWQGEGLDTVEKAMGYFERLCREADEALGEPAACRLFLHWFDETPRAQMRRELLAEAQRVLADRSAAAA